MRWLLFVGIAAVAVGTLETAGPGGAGVATAVGAVVGAAVGGSVGAIVGGGVGAIVGDAVGGAVVATGATTVTVPRIEMWIVQR